MIRYLTAASVVTAIAISPPAGADSGSYFTILEERGIGIANEVAALEIGYGICRAAAGGYSGTEIAEHIYQTLDWATVDNATDITTTAVLELCPEQRSALAGTSIKT